MGEQQSPEQLPSIDVDLDEAKRLYVKLKEVLRGYKFRSEDPPESLTSELKRLESKIAGIKGEIVHDAARKFYNEPLKPLVPEKLKEEEK